MVIFSPILDLIFFQEQFLQQLQELLLHQAVCLQHGLVVQLKYLKLSDLLEMLGGHLLEIGHSQKAHHNLTLEIDHQLIYHKQHLNKHLKSLHMKQLK